MTEPGDIAKGDAALETRTAIIRSLFAEKARAELAAADRLAPGSDAVAWRGDMLAEVMVVKGLPGPAEAAGGDALSGPDGDAAEKALEALGHDTAHVFFTLSRPEHGIDADRRVKRLRAQVEAVDAGIVIALDAEAAEDLAAAMKVKLGTGREVQAAGRRLIAVDGLEASLSDPVKKRRVWRQLQTARPAGPLF